MAELIQETTEPAPVDRRPVHRLISLTFVVAAASFVFGSVYVDQMLHRGFRPAELGVAFSCAFAATTVIEVVSGDWGDRYGQRLMATSGLLLWGVGLIGFAYSPSIVWLVASLILWSVGQAVYSGAPTALVVNSIPADQKDLRHTAVRWGQIARWIGAAAGGLIVAIAAKPSTISGFIVGSGGILCLTAVVVRLRWREHRPKVPAAGHHIWSRLRGAWRPGLTGLLLVNSAVLGMLSIFLFAWQPVTTGVFRVDNRWLGAILVGLTLFAALGSWLARFRWGGLARGQLDLWLGAALTGVLLVLMTTGRIGGTAAFIGAEILTSYVLTGAAMRAHAIFPDEARNLLWSTFSAVGGATMALVDLVFGLVWEHEGLADAVRWSLACLAGACVAGALVAVVLPRHPGPVEA